MPHRTGRGQCRTVSLTASIGTGQFKPEAFDLAPPGLPWTGILFLSRPALPSGVQCRPRWERCRTIACTSWTERIGSARPSTSSANVLAHCVCRGHRTKLARTYSTLASLCSCLPCEQPPNAFGLSRQFFFSDSIERDALVERCPLSGLQHIEGNGLASGYCMLNGPLGVPCSLGSLARKSPLAAPPDGSLTKLP